MVHLRKVQFATKCLNDNYKLFFLRIPAIRVSYNVTALAESPPYGSEGIFIHLIHEVVSHEIEPIPPITRTVIHFNRGDRLQLSSQ